MKFLSTLKSLNTAAHHFVMSGIICFMGNLISYKKANYLKLGIKYKLWKNLSINNELKVLNNDLMKITGNTINSLNDNNFYESLYKLSGFVIGGYSYYFGTNISDKKRLQELLKERKDQRLAMWLRFYFRIKGSLDKAEDESENATSYIG